MKQINYQSFILGAPFGYALHEIILDEQGEPVDFRFIEANDTFEKFTGLKVSEIAGKTASELFLKNNVNSSERIALFGKVASTGDQEEYQEFSERLGRWFRCQVGSSQNGLFYILYHELLSSGSETVAKATIDKEIKHRSNDDAYVNSLAHKLATLLVNDEFIPVVVGSIKQYTGAVISALSVYNQVEKSLKMVHIDIDEATGNQLQPLFSEDIYNFTFPVTDEIYDHITQNTVNIYDSLYSFSFGLFPEFIDNDIRKIIGNCCYYGITHVVSGRLYGTTILVFNEYASLPSKGLLQSYAHLVALSVRRNMAEQAMVQSNKKLKQITQNISDVIFTVDMNFNLTYISDSIEKLVGISPDVYMKMVIEEKYPPETLNLFRDILNEQLEKEKDQSYDKTHTLLVDAKQYKSDGTTIDVSIHITALRDEKGNPIGLQGVTRDVTARKEVENFLETTRQSYQGIFNTISEAIYVLDGTGTFIEVNKGAEIMYGFSHEELVGQSPYTVAAPGLNNMDEILKQMSTVPITGIPVRFDFWAKRKNGEIFPKDVIVNKGKYFGKDVLIATARDITEQKKDEAELRASKVRARHQSNAIARLIFDETVISAEIPSAFHRITQIVSEAINVALVSIWKLSDDGTELQCLSIFNSESKILEEREIIQTKLYSEYFRVMMTDGLILTSDAQTDPRTAQISQSYLQPLGITSMLDAGIMIQGKIAGIVCLEHIGPGRTWHSDEQAFVSTIASFASQVFINAGRKKAEGALLESEKKYRLLFETMAQGVVYHNAEGLIISANPAAEKILGFTFEDMKQLNPDDSHLQVINEDGTPFPGIEHPVSVALRSGQPVENVVMGVLHPLENQYRWLLVNAIPEFKDNESKPFQVYATFTDITDRKKAEQSLHESEATLKAIIENSLESIWSIDTNYNIQYVNEMFVQSFHNTFGIQLAKGFNIIEALPVGLIQLWKERCDKAFNNEHFVFEDRIKMGEVIIYIEVAMNPIVLDGKVVGASFFGKNITEQKLAERKLMEQNQFVTSLLRAIPVAVFYKDSEGRYLGCNDVFSEIMGVTADDIQGKTVLDLWPGEPALTYHQKDMELMEKKEHQVYEYQVKDKDGLERPVIFIKDVFYDSNGEVAGLVGAFLDITERKKSEEELIKAKEKAEESNRLKSAFLANVSHEIRTPMNGILGFLHLLKDFDVTRDEKETYINIINASGERLLNTINDLIEISKIESGQLQVYLSEVNTSEIMDYYYLFFKQQADEKKLTFKISERVPGDLSWIQTDKHKLNAILTNLIRNAIKFTAAGFVEFGNYIKENQMVFYVKDSGIGISPDQFEIIFDRFVQADNSNTRPFEGSGLGLPIVKAYIDKMNGQLWFDSEVGVGSTFYFSIPYFSVKPSDNSILKKKTTPQDKLETPLILIAEDDSDSISLLKKFLKNEDLSIIHTDNGLDTVRIVNETPNLSLVLMDIKMPGLNGFEATRRIRQTNKSLPIIAQTAFALEGDKEKAMAAGCNGYISKPIDQKELIEMINSHLGKRK